MLTLITPAPVEAVESIRQIAWPDLPGLPMPLSGVVCLTASQFFPEGLELSADRVLNERGLTVTREAALREIAGDRRVERHLKGAPLRVLREERRVGCRQSPLLSSGQEELDILVEWALKSAFMDRVFALEVIEDPDRPLINGSFLKVGSRIVPGPRARLTEWHGVIEERTLGLPSPAAEWAQKLPHDVAEIIYLEQDDRPVPWRVDDSAEAIAAYLSDPRVGREAREALIAEARDGGDILSK